MSVQVFMDALGEVDIKYVEEVLTYQYPAKRKLPPVWLKGCIAACLAIVVFVGVTNLERQPDDTSKSPMEGNECGDVAPQESHDLLAGNVGEHPEGVDPVIASIAVYPETSKVQDVVTATMETVGKDEAFGIDGLSEYLPSALPEGFRFSQADLYETTMNSGETYVLLRVTYVYGAENVVAANETKDTFVVGVMNFKPRTEKTIYAPEQITEDLLKELGAQTFHIALDNVYLTISPMGLQVQEVLGLVGSIRLP